MSTSYRSVYSSSILSGQASALFAEERGRTRLDGWFRTQEIRLACADAFAGDHPEIAAARTLLCIVDKLPLSLPDSAAFAGTQRDAFARSYALINPSFRVESFAGYCDPLAVYGDIEPNDEFPRERIEAVRSGFARTPYVRDLQRVVAAAEDDTREVAYFAEQVSGHTVADFRPILAHGTMHHIALLDAALSRGKDAEQRAVWTGLKLALQAAERLADRYADLAQAQIPKADPRRAQELTLLVETLRRVPRFGARNLYEAIQSFLLLWQVMCLEQAPNPYAFSVGNLDRILEPFRRMDDCPRDLAAGLVKHLLVFFNVGDRSWAISQNVMVGGKDEGGADLTNEMTFSVLDAFFECNFPQPILSVKLHARTPRPLYETLGRFFFTPGRLTPSVFNDDSLFAVLEQSGVARADLKDYAIAGCQEPLIMGRDNGNTTSSWLNLAKILELTLTGGRSALTGAAIGPVRETGDAETLLRRIRPAFYEELDRFLLRMQEAANGCARALSHWRVPFLSALMGGIESGIDFRDPDRQGSVYHGSGCLIHGLSVVADSFGAIDSLLAERPQDAAALLQALKEDFHGAEALRQFLASAPKYGNGHAGADAEAASLARDVAGRVRALRDTVGQPFRPDVSSPSTHLLYGYWTGATPDGRRAREMLGYGVDPLFGEATSGLGFRTLSVKRLPFEVMCGGYASHFGVDPRSFPESSFPEKGLAFADRVIRPLFFSGDGVQPFYLYVNVTTPELLRQVRADPAHYAPTGIYIMRIHGTFVNFLDLSPAIQEDIIRRLDPESTRL